MLHTWFLTSEEGLAGVVNVHAARDLSFILRAREREEREVALLLPLLREREGNLSRASSFPGGLLLSHLAARAVVGGVSSQVAPLARRGRENRSEAAIKETREGGKKLSPISGEGKERKELEEKARERLSISSTFFLR